MGMVHSICGYVRRISCSHDFENGQILWDIELDAALEPELGDEMHIHFATSRWAELDFCRGDRIGCTGTIPGFESGVKRIIQAERDGTSKPPLRIHVDAEKVLNFSRDCSWVAHRDNDECEAAE
jgi:hypothetical protein